MFSKSIQLPHFKQLQIPNQLQLFICMADEQQPEQLILQRFERIKVLEKNYKYNRYLLKDVHTGQRVQIKAQSLRESKPTVLHEAGFLQQLQGYPGFPLMIWSGNYIQQQNALFTQRLGPNLWELMQGQKEKVFSLGTVCLIGMQIVKILEILHEKNTILDEMIPQNFRISLSKVDQILVSNLLHSKRYRSSRTMQLYKQRKMQKLDFFNPFLSFGKLSLRSSCRRDDLQSLFYMLVFFRKGVLPWSKVITKNVIDSQVKVLEMHKKMGLGVENAVLRELMEHLPTEFHQIYLHIYTLGFEERPNYCLIRRKFEKVLCRLSKTKEPTFDWLKTLSQSNKKLLKPSQLTFQTEKDRQIQRQYYVPYSRKVALDHLLGPNQQSQDIYADQQQKQTLPKKHKDKCQVM